MTDINKESTGKIKFWNLNLNDTLANEKISVKSTRTFRDREIDAIDALKDLESETVKELDDW